MYRNTARMRVQNVIGQLLLEINDEISETADQDILNTYAYYHSDSIFELPCQWNIRRDTIIECSVIKTAPKSIGLFHGNGNILLQNKRTLGKEVWIYHDMFSRNKCIFESRVLNHTNRYCH